MKVDLNALKAVIKLSYTDSNISMLLRKPVLLLIYNETEEDSCSPEKSYRQSIAKMAELYGIHLYNFIVKKSNWEDLDFLLESCDGFVVISKLDEIYDNIIRSHCSQYPKKDIDCYLQETKNKWKISSNKRYYPCTALATYAAIKFCDATINNEWDTSQIAIISRSESIGKPLAKLLLNDDRSVSIFHSKAKIDVDMLYNYSYVVCAAGAKDWYTGNLENALDYLEDAPLFINIGMHEEDGNVKGDMPEDVLKEEHPYLHYIPVFNGIGPVTTAILLAKTAQNAVDSLCVQF